MAKLKNSKTTKRRLNKFNARKTKKSSKYKLAGGADSDSTGLCKKDINELLVPENKNIGSSLTGSPKQFTDDVKKQTSDIANIGKSNWLAGPGPPPALPKCTIM